MGDGDYLDLPDYDVSVTAGKHGFTTKITLGKVNAHRPDVLEDLMRAAVTASGAEYPEDWQDEVDDLEGGMELSVDHPGRETPAPEA